MPRITAAEARRLGKAKTVEQLVDQASERILDAAPRSKSVTLTGADDPAWGTAHTRQMEREKLEAASSILRDYGFEVTYLWSNDERGRRAGTIIDWSEK